MRWLALCAVVSACSAPRPAAVESIPVPPIPPAATAPTRPRLSPIEQEALDYAKRPDATAAGLYFYRNLLNHR